MSRNRTRHEVAFWKYLSGQPLHRVDRKTLRRVGGLGGGIAAPPSFVHRVVQRMKEIEAERGDS